MPKISVIVPVYRAEKTLRRCVESIVLGEEQDLEVILLEDCSDDGSWALCQKLAEEYPQVICLQNDRNRGVSYSRNRGLDAATGQYLLFVDSDDWVRGSYAKTLAAAAEENPGKLIVCEYTQIDIKNDAKRKYGISDTAVLTRPFFYRLAEEVMLQQLWNKVFSLADIRNAGIRFDESICVGEDYKFVMDVIEAQDIRECVIIQQPLYDYIRWGNGSLMDQWRKYETYEDALGRAMRLERLCGPDSSSLQRFKEGYAYRIIWETTLPKKQKLAMVREILGKKRGNRFYLRQKLIVLRSKARSILHAPKRWKKRRLEKRSEQTKQRSLCRAVDLFKKQEMTIISQNCIGGVFAQDMGLPFHSPTVNLYIPAADFIQFVKGLEHYLNADLKLKWGDGYPIGMLDDVRIDFLHYDTCQQAREDWERRKQRVDLSKVFVVTTDRDGFNDEVFEQWKKIPYPKILFTACKKYASHEDAVYFPEYESMGCVPDLIPNREFYRNDLLVNKINAM